MILKSNKLIVSFSAIISFLLLGCELTPKAYTTQTNKIEESVIDSPIVSPNSESIDTVKFFLENSGSINGYLIGDTDFKDVISSVLYDLETEISNFELNYINTKVYPYNGNIDNFLDRLNPSGINYGNTATSDLNLIFRTVLANTKGSTLGVMISDGIYSIDGDKSTILTKLKSEAKKQEMGLLKGLMKII